MSDLVVVNWDFFCNILFEFAGFMDITTLFLYFFSVHSISVFLIAGIFTVIIRKISPSLIYIIWLLVLLKLLLPVGLFNIPTHPRALSPTILLQDDLSLPVHSFHSNEEDQIIFETKNELRKQSLVILLSKETIHFLIYSMLLCWIIISVFVGLSQLVRHSRFEKRLLNMVPIVTGKPYEILFQLTKEIGLSSTPKLLMANENCSPCTIGAWGGKHLIIIPQSIIDEGDELTLKVVLTHELMHVRHNDSKINTIQSLCFILFHLHPVRIIADKWFDYYREIARDLEAIRVLNIDRRDYVKVMIRIILMRSGNRAPIWAANTFVDARYPRVERMKFLNSHLDKQSMLNIQLGYALLFIFAVLCLIHPIPF
ncbi:M56 family metallopeptidase [bacterium]|nr:M56 family metallopeptidase [bacterium]